MEEPVVSTESLRSVLRGVPSLAPEDSLSRFVSLTRQTGLSVLPVLKSNILCGMVALSDVLPALSDSGIATRARFLERPVAEVMSAPLLTVRPHQPLAAISALCAEYRQEVVPVIDADGYFHGLVLARDLLLPEAPFTPRPGLIGGMATPFGVYLTDGTLRAGVGDFALVVNGAWIGLMFVLSLGLVEGGLWLAMRGNLISPEVWSKLDFLAEPTSVWMGVASLTLRALILVVFLGLMRVSLLAGYHAAEHQVVHAIERNERLIPEIVGRMPRPHPRCGTNIMAAGIVFFNVQQILAMLPWMGDVSLIVAGLATMLTWRALGAFLQERFTTRPAREKELRSGIEAGRELLYKYSLSAPTRPNLLRRLWCMGLLQTLAGTFLTLGLVHLCELYLPFRVSQILML